MTGGWNAVLYGGLRGLLVDVGVNEVASSVQEKRTSSQ